MFSLLCLVLLIYNCELIGVILVSIFFEVFGNGVCFDLWVVVYVVVLLVLLLFVVCVMVVCGLFCIWLMLFVSIILFFGVFELDFYCEFYQCLNSLVFQYMLEDLKIVMSMFWYGFLVVCYLLVWVFVIWVLYWVFKVIDLVICLSQCKLCEDSVIVWLSVVVFWYVCGVVLFFCVLVCVFVVCGILCQGLLLCWGDVFIIEFMFVN